MVPFDQKATLFRNGRGEPIPRLAIALSGDQTCDAFVTTLGATHWCPRAFSFLLGRLSWRPPAGRLVHLPIKAHSAFGEMIAELVEVVGQFKQHALMFVVGHIAGQYPQLGCTVIPTLRSSNFIARSMQMQLSAPPWATNAGHQSEFLKGS